MSVAKKFGVFFLYYYFFFLFDEKYKVKTIYIFIVLKGVIVSLEILTYSKFFIQCYI